MEVWSKTIKELREAQDISQSELARRLKFSSGSIISLYESGTRRPSFEAFQKLAEYFDVPLSYLMEGSVDIAHFGIEGVTQRYVPLLGSIAAGEPIWASEGHIEYVSTSDDLKYDFALRVKGDSMAPMILDGDIVLLQEQSHVIDGQIAAVIVDDSATLKKVFRINDGVQIVSINTAYPPQIYLGAEAEKVRIIGLVVRISRDVLDGGLK